MLFETLRRFSRKPRCRPILRIDGKHPIKKTNRLFELGLSSFTLLFLFGDAVQDQVRLNQICSSIVEEIVKRFWLSWLSFMGGGAERQ